MTKRLKRPNEANAAKAVTTAEFVAAMVRAGMSKANAELQAKWCRILGSDVLIGGEFLTIRDEKSEGTNG